MCSNVTVHLPQISRTRGSMLQSSLFPVDGRIQALSWPVVHHTFLSWHSSSWHSQRLSKAFNLAPIYLLSTVSSPYKICFGKGQSDIRWMWLSYRRECQVSKCSNESQPTRTRISMLKKSPAVLKSSHLMDSICRDISCWDFSCASCPCLTSM